jgi:hypothetical protein
MHNNELFLKIIQIGMLTVTMKDQPAKNIV